jgi:hypothetical protein
MASSNKMGRRELGGRGDSVQNLTTGVYMLIEYL